MQVTNQTRDTILASAVFLADNVWTRLRGLLGRPPLQPSQALVIKPSTGIHTWFMGYPIDALYVDGNGRVVRALESLRPFRFGPIDLRSKLIVELPAGAIARNLTQMGDVITLS